MIHLCTGHNKDHDCIPLCRIKPYKSQQCTPSKELVSCDKCLDILARMNTLRKIAHDLYKESK
jgi:hypothetical protein